MWQFGGVHGPDAHPSTQTRLANLGCMLPLEEPDHRVRSRRPGLISIRAHFRDNEVEQITFMGPYIDHGGVDNYLVTVSVPVMSRGSFIGIMAADIRVASLERAVSPWLAQATSACVLLNSDRRVLLSNSVRYIVGDVLPADADLDLDEVGASVGR